MKGIRKVREAESGQGQTQCKYYNIYLMSLMGRSMTRMHHFISKHRAIRLRESRTKSNLKQHSCMEDTGVISHDLTRGGNVLVPELSEVFAGTKCYDLEDILHNVHWVEGR